jgi:hypothetical protein
MLLDAYTTQVLANVYSQTQILEKEFYLIEQLGANHEPMPHLKAAMFVRPTAANVEMIIREIAKPKFKGIKMVTHCLLFLMSSFVLNNKIMIVDFNSAFLLLLSLSPFILFHQKLLPSFHMNLIEKNKNKNK